MGEGLEPRAEAARGLADALRHRPDLARALGHDGDDLVGFAELVRAQDDALLFVRRHPRIVAPATCADTLAEVCSFRGGPAVPAPRRICRSPGRAADEVGWSASGRSRGFAPSDRDGRRRAATSPPRIHASHHEGGTAVDEGTRHRPRPVRTAGIGQRRRSPDRSQGRLVRRTRLHDGAVDLQRVDRRCWLHSGAAPKHPLARS